jgi:glycosyltransferase involved in cell wall biosynthesis
MDDDARQLLVSVFLPTLEVAGVERATVNLCNGLVARGIGVDVVLGRAVGAFLGDVHPTVAVVELGAKHVRSAIPRLERYLRRRRPAVLLAEMSHANVAAVLARDLSRAGTRVVVTEHIPASILHAEEPTVRHRVLPWLMRVAYRRADAIVAVSDGVRDDLAHLLHMSPDAIQVAYNPIVTPALLESRHKTPHPWLEDSGPPVVVAVGRLARQKDYPTLIRAIARVRAREPVRLVILGEGTERRRLEALVSAKGLTDDVAMPGAVATPASSIARSATYVLSSRYEGLPSVLIEALACDVPIVATNCPSGPREILAGGRHGRLVPVGDDVALADAIADALRGNIQPPEPEAWTPFTVEAVTSRYISIICDALSRSRRRVH